MSGTVISMSLGIQTGLLFSIFVSSRAVRLLLYMTGSLFLWNVEALLFLMFSTSGFFNKQQKCEV